MRVEELLRKSRSGEVLSREELVYLLGLAPDAVETYMVMAEAARLSKELSDGKAEVHAQIPGILRKRLKRAEEKRSAVVPLFFRKAIGTSGTALHAITTVSNKGTRENDTANATSFNASH